MSKMTRVTILGWVGEGGGVEKHVEITSRTKCENPKNPSKFKNQKWFPILVLQNYENHTFWHPITDLACPGLGPLNFRDRGFICGYTKTSALSGYEIKGLMFFLPHICGDHTWHKSSGPRGTIIQILIKLRGEESGVARPLMGPHKPDKKLRNKF